MIPSWPSDFSPGRRRGRSDALPFLHRLDLDLQNSVFHRSHVFDHVGNFDPAFDACEDVEFNHRVYKAGLRCFFTPSATVHYYPRSSLRGLFRQLFRYGRGRVRLLRKHPDTFSLASILPAAFLIGLIAGAPLALLSGWFSLLYGGACALYAVLVCSVSGALALKSGNGWLLPWLPLVFITVHLGYGAGVLREILPSPSRV